MEPKNSLVYRIIYFSTFVTKNSEFLWTGARRLRIEAAVCQKQANSKGIPGLEVLVRLLRSRNISP